jgi:hypothetical protein
MPRLTLAKLPLATSHFRVTLGYPIYALGTDSYLGALLGVPLLLGRLGEKANNWRR